MTDDLVEFLLARFTEDEADAMVGWRWKALSAGEYARLQSRVLADCDAKRRIVGYWVEAPSSMREVMFADLTLRLLSLPYAEHPDYDPAWRP